MAYKVPTLDGMLSIVLATGKSLLPTRNWGSRFASLWRLAKVIAGATTDLHAHLDVAMKNAMPTTARGAGLDQWIGIAAPGGSTTRKGATPARGSNVGRVVGTVGSTTSIGDQLLHRATGLKFQINEDATVPAAGFIDVDIAAIDTGSRTRLEAGEVLEYMATPTGLQNTVELQGALSDDGTDAEPDGAARARLLAALATPSAGGNQSDYVGWALAQIGIAQAFCYPNRAGIGTVDVLALHSGSGTSRILSPAEAAALLAILETLAPSGVAGTNGSDGLRVLTAISGAVDAANLANVELTISPYALPQYAFDWDDTTAPIVLSWTPATRVLQFTATRPLTMQAGHRISLKGIASSQDGSPLVIEALTSTDSVILSAAPTNAPAATDIVYAGGPLATTIRAAILAHINGDTLYAGSQGPLVGATLTSTADLQPLLSGIGSANPGGIYGPWSGTLERANLTTIARFTRGVRTLNVITPAVDQDAVDYAFPLDLQIGLLTPGYILVRRG